MLEVDDGALLNEPIIPVIVVEAVNQEVNQAFTEDTWAHDEEWATTNWKEDVFLPFF